ncbi:MAG: ATP-binding protein, partial [Cyanobacteria bacterium J06650_10]
QVSGILACALWSFALCLVAVLCLKKVGFLRVSAKEEYIGLDISEHGTAATIEDVYGVMRHHVKTGDLKRRVNIDPFTEVGRVGQWYNQVIVALEKAVATNEAIIQTAVDGILTLSSDDLIIQSANAATHRLFGQADEALINQPIHHLLTPGTQLSPQQLTVIATAREPETLMGQHQNGETFPLEITATEAQANGQRFFTVFLKDISVRQQAADALIESRAHERAKSKAFEKALSQLRHTQAQLIQRERIAGQGQLVAGIAHHINNPTNFIYGNLEYAQQYVEELLEAVEAYQRHESALPQAVRSQIQEQLTGLDIDDIRTDYPQLFESMQRGTERIRMIVQQLRNFARYEEADLKTIDFHTSLDSSLMVLAYRLEATHGRPAINVIKDYGQVSQVECYASALNRAVLNILCNAIDAFDRQAETIALERDTLEQDALEQGSLKQADLEPSGDRTPLQITIKTRSHREHLHIAISNNGPHIPKETLKKIFDPFFSTQTVGQGTGLGCTISYQIIVQQHHGQLTCCSQPGQPTAFYLEIPLTQSSLRLQNKIADKIADKLAQPIRATPPLLESSLT